MLCPVEFLVVIAHVLSAPFDEEVDAQDEVAKGCHQLSSS